MGLTSKRVLAHLSFMRLELRIYPRLWAIQFLDWHTNRQFGCFLRQIEINPSLIVQRIKYIVTPL